MQHLLTQLSDLDHLLFEQLEKSDIAAEDIAQLVDKREQLLLCILAELEKQPSFKQNPLWQEVVRRTQTLIDQMQVETRRAGDELYKFRRGQRSIQHYKKFL